MISKKKIFYPITSGFRHYLKEYQRERVLPISYQELMYYTESVELLDDSGKSTLWETLLYQQANMEHLHSGLKSIYARLKAAGDTKAQEHLFIERIDYCRFGNSHPFRIKIVNRYNDVYDYFYIKTADASRVYGLELEHILSPNQVHYLTDQSTLVEEHIAGIPGDQFLSRYEKRPEFHPKRIAKEFVKFNERCFLRLLGDMRAYNFVFDITPDFDAYQFRIRAIDFDQQFYEGSMNIYRPQYFKENYPYVQMVQEHFNQQVVLQYQQEERAVIARRIKAERHRLKDLRDCMIKEEMSTEEKIRQLGNELADHYQDSVFSKCNTMGEIIDRSLKRVLVATHFR
jgi:hypothetical protein